MSNVRERGEMLVVVLVMLFAGLLASQGFAITVPPPPEDTRIQFVGGAWTLQEDLTEQVEIIQNDLIFDGGDYTITGDSSFDGILIDAKTNVTVKNINVTNCTRGIHLRASSNTITIADSNFYNNSLYGIYLATYTSSNTIQNNTVTSNGSHGIYLNSYCNENIFTGNTVDSNGDYTNEWGIVLSTSCHNNDFIRNTISNHFWGGLRLYQSGGSLIYNNSFINNPTQIDAYATFDNTYNLDLPIGGNYWSDWSGTDSDGDGIMDGVNDARPLPGGTDFLPLTMPYSDRMVLLIENAIDFFDDGVATNGITARGRNPEIRLGQFGDMLEDALGNIILDDYASACDNLDDALGACDGVKKDLIIGPDVEILYNMIVDLTVALGC
jgi:parallel beta-helix repeat protein